MRRKIIGKKFWRLRRGFGDDLLLENRIRRLRDELSDLHISEQLSSKLSRSRRNQRDTVGEEYEHVIENQLSSIDEIHIGISDRRGSR